MPSFINQKGGRTGNGGEIKREETERKAQKPSFQKLPGRVLSQSDACRSTSRLESVLSLLHTAPPFAPRRIKSGIGGCDQIHSEAEVSECHPASTHELRRTRGSYQTDNASVLLSVPMEAESNQHFWKGLQEVVGFEGRRSRSFPPRRPPLGCAALRRKHKTQLEMSPWRAGSRSGD